MTGQEPAPEAVEAVALSMHGTLPCDAHRDDQCYYTNHATHALAFIRDAIHRDGHDADAIRDALGLSWDRRRKPQGWGGEFDTYGDIRRVVGRKWWEVQP